MSSVIKCCSYSFYPLVKSSENCPPLFLEELKTVLPSQSRSRAKATHRWFGIPHPPGFYFTVQDRQGKLEVYRLPAPPLGLVGHWSGGLRVDPAHLENGCCSTELASFFLQPCFWALADTLTPRKAREDFASLISMPGKTSPAVISKCQ